VRVTPAPTIQKVISASVNVGPRNLSLVSKSTGIPYHEVVSVFNSAVEKFSLEIQTVPDFAALGLALGYFHFKPTPKYLSVAAKAILKVPTLVHLSLNALDYRTVKGVLMTSPDGTDGSDYFGFFEDLKRRGLIESFDYSVYTGASFCGLNPELVDWKTGDYQVDWERIPECAWKPINEERKPLDREDIYIMAELIQDSTATLEKISDELKKNGVNRSLKMISYHIKNHLFRKGAIRGYRLLKPQSDYLNCTFEASFTNNMKDEYEKLIQRIPYTDAVLSNTRSGSDVSMLHVPVEQVENLFRYYHKNLELLATSVNTTIDLEMQPFRIFIPLENLDPSNKWIFNLNGLASDVMAVADSFLPASDANSEGSVNDEG